MPTVAQAATSLMRWYVRTTRFGTVHLVRMQESENSCAPNCAMMVHCRMNKLTNITDGMAIEQSMIKNVRSTVTGKAAWDPDTEYTNAADMAQLLNSFGIGQWTSGNVGDTGVTAAAVDSASFFNLSTVPIMIHVDWNGAGGHWVMIDYMFKKPWAKGYWGVVADPWDGHVHVTDMTPGARVTYNNKTPDLSWSIPPIPKTRITGATGFFSGWIVRCTGMNAKARLGKVLLGCGI
jgi:hypothetical protein